MKRRPFLSPFFDLTLLEHVVLGEISGQKVDVCAVRKGVRSSWRATFRGELVPDAAGSRLVGTVGYPLFTRVFPLIWLGLVGTGFVIAAVVAGVMLVQGEGDQARSAAGAAGFLAGMSALGVLILTVGNASGRRDEEYLRRWLARTLLSPEPWRRSS